MVRTHSLRARVLCRNDAGASAVEFALVVPVLVALVVGIIDYGLFFGDRLSVSQSARDGARSAVVNDAVVCGGTDLDCLAGQIKDSLNVTLGPSEVLVRVTGSSPAWKVGQNLQVCVEVAEGGITKLTPVPDAIRDSVTMLIEHDVENALSGQTGTPDGGWSWCA